MSDTLTPDVLRLTAEIVSAHIGNNTVAAEALPGLIQSVFQTLSTAGEDPVEPQAQAPAVPVKKSVSPDYIVCLEDGKRLKMLKRHLMTSYRMTPTQYREKWGLPNSYPMVAPAYASRRSALAKSIGLGRKPRAMEATTPKPAEPAMPVEPTVTVGRARKARGSKG